METEKVVIFLDYPDTNRGAREQNIRLDFQDLLGYLSEGRFLSDAHCYVPIDPRNEHRLDGIIESLWDAGYLVTTKVGTIAGGTYTCNFDVEIAMDMLKVVYQVKPDIVVLASGDADFVPLILDVRKAGVRVEVAAFEETAGAEILSKCSGFIDLAVYYEGYLAAQNGKQEEESIAQRYKKLIQSQNGEQDEEGSETPDQELTGRQEEDLDEDEEEEEETEPAGQAESERGVRASDGVDELEL